MLRVEVYVLALRTIQKREENRDLGGRATRLMGGQGVGEGGSEGSYGAHVKWLLTVLTQVSGTVASCYFADD